MTPSRFAETGGLSEGEHDCAVMPLIDRRDSSSAVGVFGVCSSTRSGFAPEEAAILKELSGDISYGLSSLLSTELLSHSEDELAHRTELLETVIETAPLPIFTLDSDGFVRSWNPACERTFGWPAEEAVGRRLPTVPESSLEEFARLRRRVLSGDSFTGLELERVRKDGTPVTISLSAAPITVGQDEPRRTLAIAEDITGRKQLEAERAKQLDQIRTAQKMESLGTLAGGIAHDFNNILTAVLGHAELASMSRQADTELVDHLREITKGAKRATDLIGQILKFSRQTEGELIPMRVTPIVKEAVKLLSASVPANVNIKGNWDIRTGSILADATQIHQVIMNLCTNAVHALGEAGGTITINLKDVELEPDSSLVVTHPGITPGRHVVLEISDTGHGIRPGDLSKIFEPYFTTKPAWRGTGLGLSVVHGIIRAHGGEITVESEVGVGTTFSCYFRRVDETAVTAEPRRTPLHGNGQKILFVDDELPIVDLVENSLSRLGYSVVATSAPVQALRLFQSEPDTFDVVISDYSMPEMTGTELGRRLLETRKDIPVIICTRYSEYLTEENVKQMGFRVLLMKPLIISEITHCIHSVLQEEARLNRHA